MSFEWLTGHLNAPESLPIDQFSTPPDLAQCGHPTVYRLKIHEGERSEAPVEGLGMRAGSVWVLNRNGRVLNPAARPGATQCSAGLPAGCNADVLVLVRVRWNPPSCPA